MGLSRIAPALVLCPEVHFTGFLLAHGAGLLAGVLLQLVVPDGVVEDGAELGVDGSQVNRGVGLPVFVLAVHQLVLPGDDLLRGDAAELQLSEVRQQLCPDDVLLVVPGIFLQAGFHVLGVVVDEAGEGHVHIRRDLVQLLALPGLGLPPGGKAALGGLLPFPLPVGEAVDDPPGIGFLFFVDRHQGIGAPFGRLSAAWAFD